MKRIDWTIWLGGFIGLAAIATGAWFEGLSLSFLWHPTAALIVGGGTLSAVIIRRDIRSLINAFRAVWRLSLKDSAAEAHKVELARLAWLSRSAQKSGIKVYENY